MKNILDSLAALFALMLILVCITAEIILPVALVAFIVRLLFF